MISRLKNAVSSARDGSNSDSNGTPKPEKFPYARPIFLGLTKEEVMHSRDFGMRPIITPRPGSSIPWNSGYAECINGGKSDFNEDNCSAGHMRLVPKTLTKRLSNNSQYKSPVYPDMPANGKNGEELVEMGSSELIYPVYASYFGVFDGHAGYSTSLIASKLLYKHVQDKLEFCLEHMMEKMNEVLDPEDKVKVTVDDLVVGALQEAFLEMDNQLEREKTNFLIRGGCTALVALFFNGKLYVANAGDCRAVLCHRDEVIQMSTDFTPESEKDRLNYMGWCNPELLHDEFSCMEFIRRVSRGDIGQEILCRKPGMDGWSLKTVDEEDLRFPLVNGEGKKARVMGTIGVTRGLGDHDLYVFDSDIWIKPFLSPKPEIKIMDLHDKQWADSDVLILGSDGLWDVITNAEGVSIAKKSIESTSSDDGHRYIIAAQDLVHEARGCFTGSGWRKKNDDKTIASFDDITTLVIPIKPYMEKWRDTGQCWEDSFNSV